jgi:peptidoglycan hydrolase CwlO-like protein
MIEQLLFVLGGVSISIIGYFLKKTLDELEKVKTITYENKNKLSVIEVDYLNKINTLNDKFDDLKEVMKDLTQEIKALNNKMR